MPEENIAYDFGSADDIDAFRIKLIELIELYGEDALTIEVPADLCDKFMGIGLRTIETDEGPKKLKVEYATFNTIVLRVECRREGKRLFRTYGYKLYKKQANDDLPQDTNNKENIS